MDQFQRAVSTHHQLVWTGYQLDLPKFQCTSYSSIYGYGDDKAKPMKREFGIFCSITSQIIQNPAKIVKTESQTSQWRCVWICWFSESFACVCRNGLNTTSNCIGRGFAWGAVSRLKIQTVRSNGFLTLSTVVVFLNLISGLGLLWSQNSSCTKNQKHIRRSCPKELNPRSSHLSCNVFRFWISIRAIELYKNYCIKHLNLCIRVLGSSNPLPRMLPYTVVCFCFAMLISLVGEDFF